MKIQFIKTGEIILVKYNVPFPEVLSATVKIADRTYSIINILYDYDINTIIVTLK